MAAGSKKAQLSVRFTGVAGDRNEKLAFRAAALTCGFRSPIEGAGVVNAYDDRIPYNAREAYPGHVSFLLAMRNDRNGRLGALETIWESEEARRDTINAACMLPARIVEAKTADEIEKTAKDADSLVELYMVAMMFLLSRGRIAEPEPGRATDDENRAIAAIDNVPALIRASKARQQRENIARNMGRVWKPCIAGWLKAWRHNYREQAHEWEGAKKVIRIDRTEEGRYPLLIPILSDKAKTQRMIDRWT